MARHSPSPAINRGPWWDQTRGPQRAVQGVRDLGPRLAYRLPVMAHPTVEPGTPSTKLAVRVPITMLAAVDEVAARRGEDRSTWARRVIAEQIAADRRRARKNDRSKEALAS